MNPRLWNEVREKRGLTYAIEADIHCLKYSSILIGGTSTKKIIVFRKWLPSFVMSGKV